MKTEPVYLNGSWVVSEETRPVVNPATGETFAHISYVSAKEIAGALDTAQKAFVGW
jgi:acyl-CoA reductase-like NAD-dependent aldehyde dehydrogenase